MSIKRHPKHTKKRHTTIYCEPANLNDPTWFSLIFHLSGGAGSYYRGKHKGMQHRPAIIQIRSVRGSKINKIQPQKGWEAPVGEAGAASGGLRRPPAWEDFWLRKCAWSRFPGYICTHRCDASTVTIPSLPLLPVVLGGSL